MCIWCWGSFHGWSQGLAWAQDGEALSLTHCCVTLVSSPTFSGPQPLKGIGRLNAMISKMQDLKV